MTELVNVMAVVMVGFARHTALSRGSRRKSKCRGYEHQRCRAALEPRETALVHCPISIWRLGTPICIWGDYPCAVIKPRSVKVQFCGRSNSRECGAGNR